MVKHNSFKHDAHYAKFHQGTSCKCSNSDPSKSQWGKYFMRSRKKLYITK